MQLCPAWLGVVWVAAAMLPPVQSVAMMTSVTQTAGLRLSVPPGYERLATENVRDQLQKVAVSGHTTVLYTMDGAVYHKRASSETSRPLPRSLLEIDSLHRYATTTSANANPDLACQGCPTTDTRTEVTDTTEEPWSAVGLLAKEQQEALSEEIAQCSGSLIGSTRQHVLTAGHCLVNVSAGGAAYEKITFYPGLNGNDEPFGSLNAQTVRVLQTYVNEQSVTPLALNYDFGLVTLASPAPTGTSTLNIAAGEGSNVVLSLATAGYPADKPSQTMWQVGCPNVTLNFDGNVVPGCGDSCDNIAVHDCLSYEGQSGSPIWSGNGTTNATVRAILTGALTMSDGTTLNTATELNAFVYNTIAGWYNEDVTNGLTLAPPSPTSEDSSGTVQDEFPSGGSSSSSWFHDHWWIILVAVVAVVLLVSIIAGLLTRCCRRSPPKGPTTLPYAGNAAYPIRADTNYARYGPGYYNGFGSSGYSGPPTVPGNGLTPYAGGNYRSGMHAPAYPTQPTQYPVGYLPRQ